MNILKGGMLSSIFYRVLYRRIRNIPYRRTGGSEYADEDAVRSGLNKSFGEEEKFNVTERCGFYGGSCIDGNQR